MVLNSSLVKIKKVVHIKQLDTAKKNVRRRQMYNLDGNHPAYTLKIKRKRESEKNEPQLIVGTIGRFIH